MSRTQTLSDQDILRRARPVLLRCGLAARTRDIAAAVGLTWGAIALRFGNKRALFESAMDHEIILNEPSDSHPHVTDLDSLLRDLKSQISQTWPMHLQLRLFSRHERPECACDSALVRQLAATLARHAARGEIRDDLPAHRLAVVLLAAFSGEAAEEFWRSRSGADSNDDTVETMLGLLAVNGARHAE